jgi:hypothetical protein
LDSQKTTGLETTFSTMILKSESSISLSMVNNQLQKKSLTLEL